MKAKKHVFKFRKRRLALQIFWSYIAFCRNKSVKYNILLCMGKSGIARSGLIVIFFGLINFFFMFET